VASLSPVAASIFALVKAGRRIPWTKLIAAGTFVYERAKDNLTEAERRELGQVLKKSKGDPRKLTAKDRARLRSLVSKGVRGK
jgi:hypothetical protein